MKLIELKKIRDGKYLKNYELTYLNKIGNEKRYEIVSRKELKDASDIGKHSSGVSIVATKGEQILLLKEFRMGVNRCIYNLVAGMSEENETVEECVCRELYEETGLKVKEIKAILPPAFAAVAISDTKTQIVFVEVEEGDFKDYTSENEQIEPGFYTKKEVLTMICTEEFSSRCQLAAYLFATNEKTVIK